MAAKNRTALVINDIYVNVIGILDSNSKPHVGSKWIDSTFEVVVSTCIHWIWHAQRH